MTDIDEVATVMHQTLFPYDMNFYENRLLYLNDRKWYSIVYFLEPFMNMITEPSLHEWYQYLVVKRDRISPRYEQEETPRERKKSRMMIRRVYRAAKTNVFIMHFLDIMLLYGKSR